MKEQTWQERFDEQNFTDAWAEDESNRIKQFISDLRKRDMEAMLKITDDYYDGEGIEDWNKRLQLIKEYYEN